MSQKDSGQDNVFVYVRETFAAAAPQTRHGDWASAPATPNHAEFDLLSSRHNRATTIL